jgi:hypothetical protein
MPIVKYPVQDVKMSEGVAAVKGAREGKQLI